MQPRYPACTPYSRPQNAIPVSEEAAVMQPTSNVHKAEAVTISNTIYSGQPIGDAVSASSSLLTSAPNPQFPNLHHHRKPDHPLRARKLGRASISSSAFQAGVCQTAELAISPSHEDFPTHKNIFGSYDTSACSSICSSQNLYNDEAHGPILAAAGSSDMGQQRPRAQTTVDSSSGLIYHGGVGSETAGKSSNTNESTKKRKRLSENVNKERESKGDVDSDQGGKLLLACPYYKFDPHTYSRCGGKYELKKSSDVKQHLARCHAFTSHHCPRCWESWNSSRLCRAHISNRNCQMRPWPERLLTYELNSIKNFPPGLSSYDQWYWVWKLLFVGHPPPESPYIEARGAEATKAVLRQAEPALRYRLSELLIGASSLGEERVSSLIDSISQILFEAAYAPIRMRSRHQNMPQFDPQKYEYGGSESSEPQPDPSVATSLDAAGLFFHDAISGTPALLAFSSGGNQAPAPAHASGRLDIAAEDANHFPSPPALVPAWAEPNRCTPWDEVSGGNLGLEVLGQANYQPNWLVGLHDPLSLMMDGDTIMAEPDVGITSQVEFTLNLMSPSGPALSGEDDARFPRQ